MFPDIKVAGSGKSGCTEAILNYCEKRKIPHIAIKLDQRIPYRNCEIWGQGLGLPNSIAYSLHCVSRNENAVIILDQLDALRWTQKNSSEALAVCMELIRQVENLNYERKKDPSRNEFDQDFNAFLLEEKRTDRKSTRL